MTEPAFPLRFVAAPPHHPLSVVETPQQIGAADRGSPTCPDDFDLALEDPYKGPLDPPWELLWALDMTDAEFDFRWNLARLR